MSSDLNKFGIPESIIVSHDPGVLKRSSFITVSCGCGSEVKLKISSLIRTINRVGFYRCLSCAIKLKHQDPKYTNDHSNGIKKSWSPERRQNQSDISKQLWYNDDFRQKQHNTSIDIWDDFNRRFKASILSKNTWNNEEYKLKHELLYKDHSIRQSISDSVRVVWQNPRYIEQQKRIKESSEYKELQRKLALERFNNSEYRDSITGSLKLYWDNPELRKEVSIRVKLLWSDPKYIERQANAASDPELISTKSENAKQQWKNPIIKQSIIDGIKKVWEDPSYRENASIISKRLWKDNNCRNKQAVVNPNLIKHKLISSLFGDRSQECQVDFLFDDTSIKVMNMSVVVGSYYSSSEEFLQSFHYAGFGRSSKVIYGLYLGDVLIGICKFCSPIRKESATSMGLLPKQVLELDRFCIHPNYQKKNLASWFMSRCIKLVFSSFPVVSSLISFADSTFGHTGIIYKASNWEFVHTVPPDYHYISLDGFAIHKKTLYNHAVKNNCKEAEYASIHGYEKVYGKSKIKFKFDKK